MFNPKGEHVCCPMQLSLHYGMGSEPSPDHRIRKTCRRYNIPGHAHSLTCSCFRRQPFLSRDRTRQWFIEALAAARDIHRFDLWAYVIMPEHVHLLIYPTGMYDISRILKTLKRPVTRKAIAFTQTHALAFLTRMTDRQPNGKQSLRFWQRGGGYDRNLWSPRHVWETIDYIHQNPIRRGLCLAVDDWHWSSTSYYLGTGDGPLPIQTESLPDDPRIQQS